MTTYTDTKGNHIMLCDHCRSDMRTGSQAFMLSPCKVADNYVSRDFDKGEMILCPDCSNLMGQVLHLMGMKWADCLTLAQEAA